MIDVCAAQEIKTPTGPVAMRAILSREPHNTSLPNNEAILAQMQESHVPAVGIGIPQKGRVRQDRVFGNLTVHSSAPEDTLFNRASLTKPIVSVVMLPLMSQGEWQLDEPLYHYGSAPDVAADKMLQPSAIYGPRYQEGDKTIRIKTPNGRYRTVQEMDEFLKSEMDSLGLPGLSLAVINGDKVVYYRALGVTNVDSKTKVSEETLFDAGSMTKTPFAFLVMKLVEQGVLDLDTPLYTYLPYPDIAHDARYKLITARMVLSHTSGFPNWRFFNADGKLDIKFTPGTQFLYSGEGYEYLAAVVAHLLKIKKNALQGSFEKLVAKPLGMKNACFVWDSYVAEHQATGHVDGKVAEGYGVTAKKPDFYASYSMQSEAVSYSKFLIALMHDKGLKKELFADMYTPQFPQTAKPGAELRGLGVVIRRTDFGEEYQHTGYNLNFTSAFLFNKKQKFGYVFFTNCNKGMDFNKNLEKFLHPE